MPCRFGLLLVFSVELVIAQAPTEDHYIENTFKARIGEAPLLGWYDPGRGFLATTNAPQVTIYGPLGMARTGQRKGELSAANLQAVQRQGLACELTPQDKVTAYTATSSVDTDRSLYTTKALPGSSRSGLVTVPLNSEQAAAVNRVLGWPTRGALRRDRAIAAHAGSLFYSLHRIYSPATQLLQQEAIILHGKAGQIIAFVLKRNLDKEPFCVDCENPKYSDEDLALYRPLNVFELPGFPYPLVLLDSGTVEGRARSLITFAPNGKLAQYRVYEYVVNCG